MLADLIDWSKLVRVPPIEAESCDGCVFDVMYRCTDGFTSRCVGQDGEPDGIFVLKKDQADGGVKC